MLNLEFLDLTIVRIKIFWEKNVFIWTIYNANFLLALLPTQISIAAIYGTLMLYLVL